jgi:hypothetical protein
MEKCASEVYVYLRMILYLQSDSKTEHLNHVNDQEIAIK